jgi:hypothetical protein
MLSLWQESLSTGTSSFTASRRRSLESAPLEAWNIMKGSLMLPEFFELEHLLAWGNPVKWGGAK